jgi:hypothetical protein
MTKIFFYVHSESLTLSLFSTHCHSAIFIAYQFQQERRKKTLYLSTQQEISLYEGNESGMSLFFKVCLDDVE